MCCLCIQVSETLVLRNGDFLVRDSLTSVGDFVLTCRWDNEVLHFKISKVLVKSHETKARTRASALAAAQVDPPETLTVLFSSGSVRAGGRQLRLGPGAGAVLRGPA